MINVDTLPLKEKIKYIHQHIKEVSPGRTLYIAKDISLITLILEEAAEAW